MTDERAQATQEPLTMELIVAGLEAEKESLQREIYKSVTDRDEIDLRIRSKRQRLRDVKRLLTAAKPRDRTRKAASK